MCTEDAIEMAVRPVLAGFLARYPLIKAEISVEKHGREFNVRVDGQFTSNITIQVLHGLTGRFRC
jgi:hypothetical protein